MNMITCTLCGRKFDIYEGKCPDCSLPVTEERWAEYRAAFREANAEKIQDYADKANDSVLILEVKERTLYDNYKNGVLLDRDEAIFNEKEDRLNKLEELYNDKKAKKEELDAKYSKELEELLKEKEEKLNELQSLGLYKLSQKKLLRDRLAQIMNRIVEINPEHTNALNSEKNRIVIGINTYETDSNKAIAKIEEENPIKSTVQENESASNLKQAMTVMQGDIDRLKADILETLGEYGESSVEEIISYGTVVKGYPAARIAATVRQMTLANFLEKREVDGVEYFDLADESANSEDSMKNSVAKDAVENAVKQGRADIYTLRDRDESVAKMADYEIYGYLKLLAQKGRIFCEVIDDEIECEFISEEFRS